MRFLFSLALLSLFALPASAQPVPCGADGTINGEYACDNVTLLAHVGLQTMSAQAGNDVWGWTDSVTGKEDALPGLAAGSGPTGIGDQPDGLYRGSLPAYTVATVWPDGKIY